MTGYWYVAQCVACDIVMPFESRERRDAWVAEHHMAPHSIGVAVNPEGVVNGGARVNTWQEKR